MIISGCRNAVSERADILLKQPLSVILASASSAGTIAAVRQLGASGIKVEVVASQRFCAAAWSLHAAKSYSAPPESDNYRFVERLLAIGAAHSGQILLPTSDETAWLYTVNAALLAQHFCVYQPPISSMRRILDKKLLAEAATNAGLSVLPIWDPQNTDDLTALAPTLPYPIVIKPRTHIHRLRNDKGVVVYSATDLMQQYEQFLDREQVRAVDSALLPHASRPILQQFVRVASEGVQSVSGFIDRTGELFVTRRSTKVFQRLQPLGVGVCFESLPAAPGLSSSVHRLCRELGFFGLFEVEFVRFDGGWAVIDFNPRLFNQIAIDIHRGAPLPLLACFDAAGETAALRAAVAKAQTDGEHTQAVFCDRFTLRAILFAQSLTARISREDHVYWRDWMKRHAAHTVDFAADNSDPMPGIVHALSEIYLGLKAFPRFLRSTPRVSSATASVLTRG